MRHDKNHASSDMDRRILFVQFADRSAYPPLEHSSRLLAHRGWDVVLLGTSGIGIKNLRFLAHPCIRLKKINLKAAGWIQKLQYLFFFFWTLVWTLRWKPQWIYASDPLACPIVWFTQKITNVK